MASYMLSICLFIALLTNISAALADEKPLDCPANEKYYKCHLEVCFKTCKHLKQQPPCPSIVTGCYAPACVCDHGYQRNSEGKCFPTDKCS